MTNEQYVNFTFWEAQSAARHALEQQRSRCYSQAKASWAFAMKRLAYHYAHSPKIHKKRILAPL